MNYSDLLKKYIKDSNLSLSDISEKLKPYGFNMDKAYLSRLQNNKVGPASDELNKALAEITGGDIDQLIKAGYYEKAPKEIQKTLDRVDSYDRLLEYLLKNRPIKGDFEGSGLSDEEIDEEISYLNSPAYLATLSKEDLDENLTGIVNHMIINNPDEYLEVMKTTAIYKFFENNKDKLYLLGALRKQEGKTFKEMADGLGMSETDYFMLEKISEVIDMSKYESEADVYKKGIERMREMLVPYKEGSMLRLPILAAIRAGEPIGQIENNEGYTLVDPDLLQGHEGFALRVQGDSMSGDRIQEGDIVIVLKQAEIGPNEIAVVAIDDDKAVLRRVKLHGDMVMLVPSNSLFEPQLVPAKSISIIGKVVEVKIRMK